jgi:hypothetical protein
VTDRPRVRIRRAALLASLPLTLVASAPATARKHSTKLISRGLHGHRPNGPSSHPVVSGDRRFARIIAFESKASNLVRGDGNRTRDVFFIRRAGSFHNNKGPPWKPGHTRLVSRGLGGAPANGASGLPAVDGNLSTAPSCLAFLSAASNLVPGDTNGRVDAFVSRGPGGLPSRLLLPGAAQPTGATTAVAVSGDCSRIAFVNGGRLYVRSDPGTQEILTVGPASNPSFASGEGNDLVFAAPAGVYLSAGGTGFPMLVAFAGRNPAYAAGRRHTLAYERGLGGHAQILYKDLGGAARVISRFRRKLGNRDSRGPVIANSGYYVAFESDARNLGTTANRLRLDRNHRADVYLYTDVRKLTLAESVRRNGVPLRRGGRHPSISFYANYILFDSPFPLNRRRARRQVLMRYLGPV